VNWDELDTMYWELCEGHGDRGQTLYRYDTPGGCTRWYCRSCWLRQRSQGPSGSRWSVMDDFDTLRAALYRERNGDPRKLAAERHRPVPDPPMPVRKRATYYEPVPELDTARHRRDLEDALAGIPYEPPQHNKGVA
jgi:hypothetical protein